MLDCHLRIRLLASPSSDYIPVSFFHHLPSHDPKPTARRNAIFNQDYRFGPIRIDWLDLEMSDMGKVLNSRKDKDVARGQFHCPG